MFVICDKNGVVQDIASEKANLSRGYTFADHKIWADVVGDIRIGDTIENGVLINNQQIRDDAFEQQQVERLVVQKTRQLAIDALVLEGKLPPDFIGKVS